VGESREELEGAARPASPRIDETFTSKGAYAQTNLRTEFLQSRCPAAGNVREFLENLTVRRETLATKYLADFAAGQLTFAKLHSTKCTIACGPFIHAISEEYDRKAADLKKRVGKGKDDGDEALGVTDRGKKPKGTFGEDERIRSGGGLGLR